MPNFTLSKPINIPCHHRAQSSPCCPGHTLFHIPTADWSKSAGIIIRFHLNAIATHTSSFIFVFYSPHWVNHLADWHRQLPEKPWSAFNKLLVVSFFLPLLGSISRRVPQIKDWRYFFLAAGFKLNFRLIFSSSSSSSALYCRILSLFHRHEMGALSVTISNLILSITSGRSLSLPVISFLCLPPPPPLISVNHRHQTQT